MDWKKLLNPKRVRELLGGEKSISDSRTEFERDYGRAAFSTPVRRLQDKTQVFPLEEHDAVRTRLTHSLEVSSVSRNLGREVGLWLAREGRISDSQVHDIETIAATCGLIHDLGNPPFGHSGEAAIQSWFVSRLQSERISLHAKPDHQPRFEGLEKPDKKGIYKSQNVNDFLNWEGNAQTLRLVSKLQVLADDFGINLTCGTFSAACKYTARSNELNDKIHEKSKMGFFASEEETVENVAKETGTVGIRNPITYLVEASDDIVYSTGDLEDGVRKRLMDWPFLKAELLQFSSKDPLVKKLIKKAEKKVQFRASDRPLRNEEVAQAFRTFSIGAMKDAALLLFCKRLKDIESGTFHEELVKDTDCEAAAFVDACKKVGQKYVYPSPSTIKLELMGRRVIHDLMDAFGKAPRPAGANPNRRPAGKGLKARLSRSYRAIIEACSPEHWKRAAYLSDTTGYNWSRTRLQV